METFFLFDEYFKAIPLLKGIPEAYNKYVIKGAIGYHAKIDERSIMLFQSIDLGEIEICISHYLVNHPMKIFCTADCESLELHNMIQGEAQYRLKGFEWRRIKAGQHNLIYLTNVKNETYFKGNTTITFDIHLSKELLQQLANQYPKLHPIWNKIKKEENGSLYIEFADNSAKSMHFIVRIMELLYQEGVGNPQIKLWAMDLLKVLLEADALPSKYRYSYEDIKTIDHAATMLIAHQDEKNVLANQLRKSHLNADKFREGFRLLFGQNPKQFLLSKKMEQVKILLGKGYTLDEICERTGYSTVSHLEEAFVRYNGHSIGSQRKTKK
ncbi:helix-turn-helix domain-containing protein [Arachidicoccus sp.]|uniref:helix-turn-helix domain-containing protein n=1 Tax=Arachidicoccus sp. TaxID=1872624 RepID=UPI003D1AAC34